MAYFIEGKTIKTFISKGGHTVIIRYPVPGDIPSLTRFVNEISLEDTFISFSGEQLTEEEEKEFLDKTVEELKLGTKVFLCTEIEGRIAATAHIEQLKRFRTRSLHVGELGIMILRKYRNMGIGYQLSRSLIDEAKVKLKGLKIVTLSVVAENEEATKLYTKLGFKKMGVLPDGFRRKGKYYDIQYMYLEL